MTLHRRQFLRWLGVGVVARALGACSDAAYEPAALARPALLAALGAPHVRAIGAAYRAMAPAERDARTLATRIRAARPWTTRLGVPSPPVAALVQADFDQARTVVVDGWVLSLTEARQCALFSLLG